MNQRGGRTLTAWRHILGGIVTTGLLGTAGPAAAADRTVDVVTFNAWGLPPPLATGRKHRLPRASAWVKGLQADLVAVQEVWNGAVPHWTKCLTRSSREGDDGLGLQTDAALTDVEVLRFADGRSFDALKRKGALRARWAMPDGPEVWVVVTHLQSGWGAANGRVRAAQVAQILDWIGAVDEPVLLLGDFNVDERHAEDLLALERLSSGGFVDAAAWTGVGTGTFPEDGRRYDRILVRAGKDWRVVPQRVDVFSYDDDPDTLAPPFLSDHLPVRASLRFVPRG